MNYQWVVEVNFFCLICLIIIHLSINRSYDRGAKQRSYIRTMQMAMLSFICDSLWALTNAKILNFSPTAVYLINAVYFISVVLCGYWWLCYVEISLESRFIGNKFLNFVALIPVIITIIGVLLSYINGFFFYIDENSIYHRGSYILIHTVCCQQYTIVVSSHAFIRSLRTKNYLKAKEYRVLSLFLFFPLSLGIIQIIFPSLPTVCIGLTLAYLYVYIDLQDLKISIDPLSGINNRNQLIKYLTNKMRTAGSNEELYLLMIDVNKFKKINDTYGHIEGDKAIIRVSEALKKANANTSSFVGRYGGDEFIVICSNKNEEQIKQLIEDIHSELKTICEKNKLQYSLTLSVGYEKYTKDIKNMQDFISRADRKLYIQKELLK